MKATQVSIHKWMDKQNGSIPTMEYYSASKRKEILTQATTWMNVVDIMLNEIGPSKKDKFHLH